jgi:hypothetical protein
MEPSLLIVLSSDVRIFLHHATLSSWKDEWADTHGNKLHMVKPSMQTMAYTSFSTVGKEEVMLTRP